MPKGRIGSLAREQKRYAAAQRKRTRAEKRRESKSISEMSKRFNPAMKKGKTNTWISGKAFKVVRKGGKTTVLVKK